MLETWIHTDLVLPRITPLCPGGERLSTVQGKKQFPMDFTAVKELKKKSIQTLWTGDRMRNKNRIVSLIFVTLIIFR